MNRIYSVQCKDDSVILCAKRPLTLPASAELNGGKLNMTLRRETEEYAEYGCDEGSLRFDFHEDCVKVSFIRDFGEVTPITACRLFAGGVKLEGFDRAFTVQPRNNAGKNIDYFNHLPDVSANGYFSPPLLNMTIGTEEGWVGFGLLDLPDSKLCRMEEDGSLLLESAGGNNKVSLYRAPELLITFPDDEWQAISLFRQKLIDFGRYTPAKPAFSEVPSWWKDPLLCTYGDQMIEHRVGQKIDDAWVCDFVDIMERDYGVEHMNLIIDDSWQPPHSFDPVTDPARFPDMRDFCDRMHARGHHVILWCTPLFDKITNGFETRAQKDGVLSSYLYTKPYFQSFPGCYAIDYTADNARQFLHEVCEILFGHGEGQWDADGVKLDFIGNLRDPAETDSYAHPERGVGMRELYAFFKMFSEEARRVKPDVLLDSTTGDPRYEDFLTHNRLHDTHSGVEEKEMRARIASLACPDLIIDSDGALMYTHWMRNHYIAAAVYSVPSYYYAKKLQDVATWNDGSGFTPEEHEHKALLTKEKQWFGTLFQMTKYRPDGQAVMDDFGNWRLVDDKGVTTAVSLRGDAVIYYPTEKNRNGYIFSFRSEAMFLPLYGHKFAALTPAAHREHLLVDYARDRILVHLKPGVLYTFRDEDDGQSIDRIFSGSAAAEAAESEMNYVN